MIQHLSHFSGICIHVRRIGLLCGLLTLVGCQPRLVEKTCAIHSTGASGLRTATYEFRFNAPRPSRKVWFVVQGDTLLCNSTEEKIVCYYSEDPDRKEAQQETFFDGDFLSGTLHLQDTKDNLHRLPINEIQTLEATDIRP